MTLGRIVTRDSGTGKVDLIIGIGLMNHTSELFKTNKVYEIKEYNGTLILQEVGNTCIPESFSKDVDDVGVSWASNVSDIVLCGKHVWLTESEYKTYLENA